MGADWETLAFIHIVVGFEADVFGMVGYEKGYENGDDSTKAMLIIAFILYIVAAMMSGLIKLAGVTRNIIFNILTITALIFAGIFIIIGIAIHGDKTPPYAATLECTGALMAFLGAAFLLVNRLTGGNKTGSS